MARWHESANIYADQIEHRWLQMCSSARHAGIQGSSKSIMRRPPRHADSLAFALRWHTPKG
eukprot:1189993-Pleurochrysis_carterae.AAC.2